MPFIVVLLLNNVLILNYFTPSNLKYVKIHKLIMFCFTIVSGAPVYYLHLGECHFVKAYI